jgi:DNA-binding transcriptional LysR family regulator
MNIELDPSLLRTFVAAVDMMSFSKAASLVHKSPATVSMQIAKLEERLDTVFFIRDT